ncbi:MAG: sugar ABC transporter ATP-binding protein [Promicromonosporaceae bacterium]|nr:sugar ABC transporter ATP-binding protein [Promicromonosporaceae bacterium]
MTHPILEMRSITKTFPGVIALEDVNFTVKQGEIHAICGENGAGKSTLMKVLSGVHPHGSYTGEIIYRGEPVSFNTIRQSEEAGIVIIHQELALIPELSVAENIFLGNEQKGAFGIDWTAAHEKARELTRMVGLDADTRTPIKNLGVGQQQLVEIARALAKNVELLILDEPTAALNEDDSALLLDLLRDLRAKGLTCVIISHKLNEIMAISDQITVIRDGLCIETMNVNAGDVSEDRIIAAMVGRSLDSRFPPHTPNIGEVFFEVEGWTVEHPEIPGRLVAKGSSFNVRRGEIVGFAGIMGAGRTELARSIFGRTYGRYLGGTIYIDGEEVKLPSVPAAIKHKISYVPEDRKVYGLNLLDDIQTTVVSADWKKVKEHGALSNSAIHEAGEAARSALGIKAHSVSVNVATLSGGNQQKTLLGKWLFPEPELLIVDEPTRGIDVGAKYEIYGLINELADAGKGVVVISSELPELIGLCDRIYTICEGAVTGVVARGETDQEQLMRLMTGVETHGAFTQTTISTESNEGR